MLDRRPESIVEQYRGATVEAPAVCSPPGLVPGGAAEDLSGKRSVELCSSSRQIYGHFRDIFGIFRYSFETL
jgi:hypothetical protein